MKKTMIVIRGTASESYEAFRRRVFALAGELGQAPGLSLTITERPPPRWTVIPFRRSKVAVLSVYGAPLLWPPVIEGLAGIYAVEEALPVAYERDWPDGTPTPGVCLLTLFRQKRDIDRATFLDRWHNQHTPLSLRLHPLWHYNRNVVVGSLNRAAPRYDGIVEEHFRHPADLLNPFKFFGSPATMLYHMLEEYLDVRSFLDYGSIEPYLVREYHLTYRKTAMY